MLGPSSPRHTPPHPFPTTSSPAIPAVQRPPPEGFDADDVVTEAQLDGITVDVAGEDKQYVNTTLSQMRITPKEVVLRPAPVGKRRARFYPDEGGAGIRDEDVVETSCTDSDASATDPADGPVPLVSSEGECRRVTSDERFAECTRINTKLNSMPSGGAFSFMNSSEDITSASRASSDSSTDDEDLRSSRRMIRVDGSAKLSSASGLADDDMFNDDEFGIEGAEKVDEEEAIQVRSFGRSFARVSLKDGGGDDIIIPDPRRGPQRRSGVAFTEPSDDEKRKGTIAKSQKERVTDPLFVDEDDDTYQDIFFSKSAPPRRKSKIRIAFTRRSSNASSCKKSGEVGGKLSMRKPKQEEVEDVVVETSIKDDSDTENTGMSCFPSRKAIATKQRGKVSASESRSKSHPATNMERGSPEIRRNQGVQKDMGQLVSVPDMTKVVMGDRERKPKKDRHMVKNVSLQRDDWIDFATNAKQRNSWLVRLVSNNSAAGPADASPSSSPSKRNSRMTVDTNATEQVSPVSKRTSRPFWKWWSRK